MKIAFVASTDNLLSKLIKWFTKSQWTHVMLILDDTVDGDSVIVEASALHGLALNLLSKYARRKLEIFQDKQDIWDINSIKVYIGNNYGYLQLLGIGLAKIFKLNKNPFSSNKICSELVLEWLLQTNYVNEFQYLDPNLVSPEDLYNIISKSSNFKLIKG